MRADIAFLVLLAFALGMLIGIRIGWRAADETNKPEVPDAQ